MADAQSLNARHRSQTRVLAAAAMIALYLLPSVLGARALPTAPAALPRLAGRTLSEALELLQDRGWPVVFSSALVHPSMRVVDEPAGSTPRELLADLVRAHGLAVRDGARGRLVVVTDKRPHRPRPPVTPSSGKRPAPIAATAPSTTVREEIVVTPDRDTPVGAAILPFTVDPGDGSAPPRLGDDALSAVSVLPGASSMEGSTRLNVRGGGEDEVLVLLDGLELVTPYHLGDFDSAVSFVTASSVERAELFTGAYPAQYGDRMSGVVDLTTRMATRERHLSLGLDVVHVDGAASGLLDDHGSWLATARGGSYQWPLELSGRDEHPHYWDVFGKLNLDLGGRQTLLADALVALDEFELSSEHRTDDLTYRSEWDNRYAWIRHAAVLGRDLYVETVVGSGRVGRDRVGSLSSSESGFEARERRDLDLAGVRQDWQWEAGHRGALKWGFDLKRSDTRLDFWSERELAGPLEALRGDSLVGAGAILRRFHSTHLATYGSTQLHPARAVSLELGLRHDTIDLSDESHLSPRLAAAWDVGPRSVLRAAWGWFYQSQRPYELQLEETGTAGGFAGIASERAEHHVLSFEHRLERGTTLRVEAYRRRLDDPRARFENLFDPVGVFPELGEDRVRVAPEGATAQGVELTVRQSQRRRLSWWTTYVRSSLVDEIEKRSVPRSIDQPHSLRAGLSYRAGRSWDLDLLWQYHTGWPTTSLEARQLDTEDGTAPWFPVIGPRNAERLPDYHRLDLRLGRYWKLGPGSLSAHLDLLDVYDRQNLRGFENLRLEPVRQGALRVTSRPVTWNGFVPALGVRFEF